MFCINLVLVFAPPALPVVFRPFRVVRLPLYRSRCQVQEVEAARQPRSPRAARHGGPRDVPPRVRRDRARARAPARHRADERRGGRGEEMNTAQLERRLLVSSC